jgi:dihydroxyacetone kinase-like protein
MTFTHDDVVRWLRSFQAVVAERRDELTDLDAAIGDADHGVNMDRGMRAVVAKLDAAAAANGAAAPPDIGATLKTAGMTLVSTVGGAGGPLYGTFFLQMGAASAGAADLDGAAFATALAAGVNGVQARGKAELGDKTMVDTLAAARDALTEAVAEGALLPEALARAAEAGEAGMRATIPMVARKGRASYLGERSAGHQDPGATSSWLLVRCAAEVAQHGGG